MTIEIVHEQNQPLISVVTVCYNAATTIEATIQSVINQTYPHIEYIIIDGGSTDGTVDIIKRYANRIAYWVSEPDKGIYDAMNKGIEVATGEWINFMNAGDWFYDECVLSNVFTKPIHSYINIVYGKTLAKYDWGNYIVTPPAIHVLNKRMCLCHQSIFIRGSYHKAHLYDLAISLAADYDMIYHCYTENPMSFLYSSTIICVYDAVEGVSAKNAMESEKEISKISGYQSLKTSIKRMINNKWFSVIIYRCYLFFHPRFKHID